MSDDSNADSGADSGRSSPEPGTPRDISEIQVTIGEHSKFIADNFDALFDEVELLKRTLATTETDLRDEMNTKIKVLQEVLMQRIEMLEARSKENEAKFVEEQSRSKQQASQYDTLQAQVGVLFFRFH